MKAVSLVGAPSSILYPLPSHPVAPTLHFSHPFRMLPIHWDFSYPVQDV